MYWAVSCVCVCSKMLVCVLGEWYRCSRITLALTRVKTDTLGFTVGLFSFVGLWGVQDTADVRGNLQLVCRLHPEEGVCVRGRGATVQGQTARPGLRDQLCTLEIKVWNWLPGWDLYLQPGLQRLNVESRTQCLHPVWLFDTWGAAAVKGPGPHRAKRVI